MKIDNIKCDWRGCPNITNKICKMSDLPEELLGKIVPSYEVWVKICSHHGIKVLVEELDFVVKNPRPTPGWADFLYKCIRCGNEWQSIYLNIKHEEFGKLPRLCTKCNSEYWYKKPRMIRETGAAPRRGKWKETKVYHEVTQK